MDAMIKISIDEESIKEMNGAILAILDRGKDHEQETIRKAFDVLIKGTRIEGTTISDCTLTGSA